MNGDSLNIVKLVIAIEDKFEIGIEDQIVSQIVTLQDTLDYIEEKWDK